MKQILSVLLATGLIFSACKKESNTTAPNPSTNSGKYFITFTMDGKIYGHSYSTLYCTAGVCTQFESSNGQMIQNAFAATSTSGISFLMNANCSQTVNPLCMQASLSCSLDKGTQKSVTGGFIFSGVTYSSYSVSVTLTEVGSSGGLVKGTFSGSFKNDSDNTQKTITGEFSAYRLM